MYTVSLLSLYLPLTLFYPTHNLAPSTLSGGLISYSVLGWTWLLPAHQTMIGAMIGAVNQISDALALPGVYLVNNNICTLQFFFYLLAISSIFSAFVIYLISPSHAENARHFGELYGIVIAYRNPSNDFHRNDMKKIRQQLKRFGRLSIAWTMSKILSYSQTKSVYSKTKHHFIFCTFSDIKTLH